MVPAYPKKAKKIIDERQLNLEDFNKPTHFLQDNVENNAVIEYFFLLFLVYSQTLPRGLDNSRSILPHPPPPTTKKKGKGEKEGVCAYKKLYLNI